MFSTFRLTLLAAVLFVSAAHAKPIPLKYIPKDAVAAAVFQPRQAISQPGMEMLPLEVATAAGMQACNVDPLDIEQVIVVVGELTMQRPPEIGVIVRLSKDYDWKEDTQRKIARLVRQADIFTANYIDARTVLLGQGDIVKRMTAATGKEDSPLLSALKKADDQTHAQVVVSVDAARNFVEQAMENAPPVPAPFLSTRHRIN